MPTWILTGIVIGAAAWYMVRIRHPNADGFAPEHGFPVLYLIWFGLGSMNLVAPDPDAPLWDYIPADLWVYAGAGIAAYCLGIFVLPRARPTCVQPHAWREQVDRWNHGHALLVGVGLLGLIAGSYLALAAQGSLALLSDDPGAARVEWQGPRIVWSVYHSALLTYVPLALLYVWARSNVSTWLRRFVYCSIAVLLVMTLMFGNRSGVFEPALLAFVTYHYVRRPVTLRTQIALGVSAIVLLSVGGIYRDMKQWGPTYIARIVTWGFPIWSLPFTYMYSYVRDGVMTLQRLREIVPAFSDFSFGAVNFAAFAAVLPGHQESADMIFKRLLMSEFVGFGQPATVLGPMYVDGGIVAVIAGMFLFGLLCRFVHTRMQLHPTPFRILLHVWMVRVGVLGLFAGLLPALTTVFVPLLTYVLVMILSTGQRSPAAATANQP